ncbi:hypothetical protein RHSIM_Rhsim06G0081500 [Rhododendron simsii]|uniref:Protein FAR1-RELATED SEQUENCE n=1 Tax=Rhododendron simsii TaxID=118357 RepID=A0A834LLP9_RHOSS|nr:hypothetical protein RHSIM_Rhsim06G0081500 [Rhododendron simsii]
MGKRHVLKTPQLWYFSSLQAINDVGPLLTLDKRSKVMEAGESDERFCSDAEEVSASELVMVEKVMVDHDFQENFVESETMLDSNVQNLSENEKDDHEPIKPSSKRDPIEPCKDDDKAMAKAIAQTGYKIEAEAAEVYTRKNFKFFQEELFSSQKQQVSSKYHKEGVTKIYKVVPNGKESPTYEVALDVMTKKVTCSCRKFEFLGILCRHILAVFIKKSLAHCLLQQYVLRRWTTNAKSDDAYETLSPLMRQNSVQEGTEVSPILLRHGLMIEVMKVVEEGQKSQKKRDHFTLALKKLHCELLTMDDGSDEIENDDLEGATLVEGLMWKKVSLTILICLPTIIFMRYD